MLLRTFARHLTALVALACAATALAPSAAHGSIIANDTFWKDTAGNPIYSQGGGIFKFNGTYYWYGVKYNGAVTYYNSPTAKNSDSSFVAVTCYSSTDLVNWKFENNILTRSTAGLANVNWFARLGVVHNANTGRYVLLAQCNFTDGSAGGQFFGVCSTPTGNFTKDHVQTTIPGMSTPTTGDQTVFTDTDGTSYLIACNSNGRTNLYVARIRPSDSLAVETASLIYTSSVGREGNCMFKYNGRYYFCSSDLHGWNASPCYVISSTSIQSGYSAETTMANSALDFCHVTQTGFFVTVAGTSGTTVLFCGDRWSDFAGNGLGYNQWCPVTFNGSTPIFNSLSRWDFNAAAGTWSVAPGNNYVLNSSYEADRIIQTSVAGWTTSGTTGSFTNGNTGRGHTGNFYVTHTATSAYDTTTLQTITGLPNGTYTLKLWYQSSGGQSTCRAFARNFGGTQLNANLNAAASSWTQQTISGINVTNGQCDIGVESVAASGQWVRFDDWELTGPTNAADTYQAETAVAAGGVTFDSANSGFNGSAYANFPTTGGTLTFNNVDGNGGGSKSLAIRYANGTTTARTGTITVNGVTSNVTFNATGSWTTWATMNVNITLNNTATNTIRFASNGQDLGNIDQITVP